MLAWLLLILKARENIHRVKMDLRGGEVLPGIKEVEELGGRGHPGGPRPVPIQSKTLLIILFTW
jgi:hypothetical protein